MTAQTIVAIAVVLVGIPVLLAGLTNMSGR